MSRNRETMLTGGVFQASAGYLFLESFISTIWGIPISAK